MYQHIILYQDKHISTGYEPNMYLRIEASSLRSSYNDMPTTNDQLIKHLIDQIEQLKLTTNLQNQV